MKRKYYPGSEWIYYKIYLSPMMADQFMIGLKKNCLNPLLDKSLIDKWFFIRYEEQFFHIRLRLHINSLDTTISYKIMSFVNKCIEENSVFESIWNITIDTYNREIERYHEALIEDCETFFFIDSCNTIDLLSSSEGNELWQLAFGKIDILLKSIMEKYDTYRIVQSLSTSYLMEFGHLDNHRDLDKMYRNRKSLLNKLTDSLLLTNSNIKAWKDLMYSDYIHSVLCRACEMNILDSIIHMLVNRIMANEQRTYEMAIYFFLEKYYKSLTFINKQKLYK